MSVESPGLLGSVGNDSSDETLNSDRLLLRRRAAACVMRGFPISSYGDAGGGDCLSGFPGGEPAKEGRAKGSDRYSR